MNRKLVFSIVVSLLALASLACTLGGALPSSGQSKTTPAATSGSKAPAAIATAPAGLPANAKAAILQSAAKLRDLKSYRMKTVAESGGKTMTTVQAVVAPNKVHLTTDYGEVIHIGDDMYTKSGNAWTKKTQPGQMTGPEPYVTADMIQDERKEGSETVAGMACDKFFYKTKSGDKPSMDVTVWISVKDGLPYKIVTKAASGGTVTQTLYDVGADIKIEPPVAGQASGPTPVSSSGGAVRQWATSAKASTEYGSYSRTAKEATGKPNTPECGEMNTAWQSEDSDTVEWIELRYDTAVYPTQVNIVQSNNPSQVSKVELIDTSGAYHQVYAGAPQKITQCPYTLSIAVKSANYKAAGVKITIDQTKYGGHTWNAIDAVELVGQSAPASGGPAATATRASAQASPSPAPAVAAQPGWTNFTTQTGLGHNDVKSIAIAADGTVWAGTNGGGLMRYDGKTWTTYLEKDGLVFKTVLSVAIAPGGVVWAGTLGGGVSRFDGKTWTTFKEKDGLPGGSIQSITVAQDGAVWFATNKGVARYDGKAWKAYTTKDGLAYDTVWSVALAPNGTLWAGTWQGVSSFDGKTWTTYKAKDGLAKDLLNAVAVDAQGVLWAGTGGAGASRFDGKTWTTYGTKDGVGLIVQAIAFAPDGAVWLGTTLGAHRFDGKAWTTYTTKTGLVNDGVQAIAVAKDGTVWIGTKGGLSRYAPGK